MKILKNNVVRSIKKMMRLYGQFDEHVEKQGAEKVVDTWIEVLNSIDYDYEEANDDFEKAVNNIATKSTFCPTLADIVEEMRAIYTARKYREYQKNQEELAAMRLEMYGGDDE